jgi:hypothetical protein
MLDGLSWCAMDVRPVDLGHFLQQRRSDVTLTAAPQTASNAQERRLYPDIGLLGVRFISLITMIGLALAHRARAVRPSRGQTRWRLVTLLRVCEVRIMIAVATVAALASRRSIVLG